MNIQKVLLYRFFVVYLHGLLYTGICLIKELNPSCIMQQWLPTYCVHNSCRSQIAEALGKHLASDVFECYSAGTEIKPQINQDAVRLMKDIYGIDIEKTQKSKLLEEIPTVDIVVTMGCNVQCPFLPCKHREDWGLEDPSGKCDEEFVKVIQTIEEKIMKLKNEINHN